MYSECFCFKFHISVDYNFWEAGIFETDFDQVVPLNAGMEGPGAGDGGVLGAAGPGAETGADEAEDGKNSLTKGRPQLQGVGRVRSEFPETWIWTELSPGYMPYNTPQRQILIHALSAPLVALVGRNKRHSRKIKQIFI